MVVQFYSFAVFGMELSPIRIEMDLSNQLPAFTIVGLASTMIQESRDRIRSAVTNSSYEWPGKRITANLLPVDLPKWGSHFELPMALGVLELLEENPLEKKIFSFGSLSLSGEVLPTPFAYNVREFLKHKSDYEVILAHPKDIDKIRSKIDTGKIKIFAISHLSEWKKLRKEIFRIEKHFAELELNLRETKNINPNYELLKKVKDEPYAVLGALCVLVNSQLHFLLVGPHGTGKSMIARAIGEALGVISEKKAIERLMIDEMLGQDQDQNLSRKRPLRYLQTTTTRPALEGSVKTNGQILPGELSQAHGGILVMDEFVEYRRDVIECLRQPLEEGIVRIQRAKIRSQLPASFQLIATSNLCPCGHFLSDLRKCRCSTVAKIQYQKKLSGPMIDRFDIIVMMSRSNPPLSAAAQKLSSSLLDSSLWGERIKKAALCLEHIEKPVFDSAHLDRSKRSQEKLARLSQTIAALDLKDEVISAHIELAKALRFNLERSLT